MFTILAQREVFHIAFLRLMAGKLKPNTYAVKGGVNLRLFLGSVRYSEDMDIDIGGIPAFQLKDIVMGILSSKILQTTLRPFQVEKIVPPDIKAAKQTETTQRFKVHLITFASEDLFTKIEFSRRNLEKPIVSETIDLSILQSYKLSPLIVSHYPVEVAIFQKINALACRTETQARDIFDIYMLLPRIEKEIQAPKDILKRACDNAFSINFEVFRDTVLNYLSEPDRQNYDNGNIWEEMQMKVVEFLAELVKL